MAELINNVKMRLILPNNDQESFVNAINYNFHQLANIANHVDAKRGERGEQGIRGAQGPIGQKGDRGPGIFTFTGNPSDLSSGDEYIKFIDENSISDGDMIMYDGVIYNYDKTPVNMNDYINDHSGEDGKNMYINTDMSGDIEAKVKDVLSEDIAGSMTWEQIDGKNAAFVTPKTADVVGAKIEVTKQVSLPAVFTTGLDPDTTKKCVNELVNNYSINSLCNEYGSINIRLGFEKFVDKNFATINFYEPSEPDNESRLIFDLRDDAGKYSKTIAKYIFNAGGESIASIFKDGSDKSIKIGDDFIFKKSQSNSSITSNGGIFVENSGGGNLTISNASNSIDNSYIRISKDSSSTRSSYISIDSYSISIQNNHPAGFSGIILNYGSTGSYLELNAESIYNKRTKRINLSAEEVIKLSKSRNYISIDNNNNIDICNDDGNEQVIAQRRIKVSNTEVLLSNDVPTGYSHIKLYNVKNGSSSIEVSSSKYIISYDSFDNIKNKNGIGLTDVNIDSDGVSFERTYLASDKTLALASNNNILLFPGKLKDDGNGYIHLYTDKLLIHNDMYYVEKYTPGWIGFITNGVFRNAKAVSVNPRFFYNDEYRRLCVKPIVFSQYVTFNIYVHAYGGNETLSMYMDKDDDLSIEMLYDYIKSVGCSSSDDTYHIGLSLSLIPLESKETTINTNEIVAMCQIGAYLKDDKKHIYVRIHTENFNSDNSRYYDWMGTITVPYK